MVSSLTDFGCASPSAPYRESGLTLAIPVALQGLTPTLHLCCDSFYAYDLFSMPHGETVIW